MADTPIDELTIEIEAKANEADKTIDNLCQKINILANSLSKVDIGKLNNMGNGIERLGKSLQTMKSVDARSIKSIVEKINKLSAIDTSQFATVSANLQQMANGIQSLGTVSANVASVEELASNISKLGNKSVQNAVTNIPQLANALNGLMDTLSHAPTVSQNVIDMTNALANLSAQGSKVGSASNSIVKGLNRASTSATRANKSFKGLASTFGKFYANCFLVIRGVKSLWKSINSTADYLEAFNYFEVALNEVGKNWAASWEKYADDVGVSSAKEYADSFKERLTKELSGLSGLKIEILEETEDSKYGLLTDTGMKNLGLNIQEVTQYASQLASVTNSVGQTGEVTLAAASAFTKLGADMSSLFNTDYSAVMNNLQSGLIGQSRALYKYGIDITNATLQTYAYELGVEKAVSEMTQAEKMQLRMIAILDQSRVSWGDQANTINSLSNSIRQFKNNISEAGRILGQLFVPIMSKLMPIVNGTTIAIKRLMVSMAGLMGIKLDLSEFGQGTSDITDDMDSLTDSLDGIAESAEKAKKGIRGFDELKTISTSSNSDTNTSDIGESLDLTQQILDATAEYESAWQEAYDRMENEAITFADKIEEAFEPIKNIFQDFAIDGFQSTVEFITNTLLPNLQSAWQSLKETLSPFVDFLSETFVSIWQDMINPALTYVSETIIPSVIEVFKNLWNNVLVPLGEFLADVFGPIIAVVSDILTMLWQHIVLPLANAIGKTFSKAFEGIVELINETVIPGFSNMINTLNLLWKNAILPLINKLWGILRPIVLNVFNTISGVIDSLGDVLGGLIDFITGVFTGNWKKAWNGVVEVFKGIVNGIGSIFEGVINGVIGMVNNFLDGFDGIVSGIGSIIGLDISIPKIPTVSIPKLEVGGFVPSSYTLFMAGENRVPEMLGTVGGKTAVAGGAEITGISDTIRATSNEEMVLLRQQNVLLQAILEKEYGISQNDIGKAAQSWARDYSRRTGREAYSF